MGNRFLLAFLFSIHGWAFAQNLVRNPSFEGYYSCPISMSRINDAIAWMEANATPDYFHVCSFHPLNSVPNNSCCGSQAPASGQGYGGEIFYGAFNSFVVDFREYAYVSLLSPLVPGSTYYVSFKVSLADFSNRAVNRQGVKFCSNYVYGNSANNIADVYGAAVITDKTNWVTVSGSFVASMPHNAMMVGNWFSDVNTTVQTVTTSTVIGTIGYYYMDDFYVGLTPFVLPITWTHTGVDVTGKVAHLSWQIEAEDIEEFFIERSQDGQVFEESQTVVARGQGMLHAVDDTMTGYGPSTLYRIRAVARDGSTHLSSVLEARRYDADLSFMYAYPSPIRHGENLTVEYNNTTDNATQVEFIALDGKLVRTVPVPAGDGSAHQLNISMDGIAPGAYLLRAGALVQKVVVTE